MAPTSSMPHDRLWCIIIHSTYTKRDSKKYLWISCIDGRMEWSHAACVCAGPPSNSQTTMPFAIPVCRCFFFFLLSAMPIFIRFTAATSFQRSGLRTANNCRRGQPHQTLQMNVCILLSFHILQTEIQLHYIPFLFPYSVSLSCNCARPHSKCKLRVLIDVVGRSK